MRRLSSPSLALIAGTALALAVAACGGQPPPSNGVVTLPSPGGSASPGENPGASPAPSASDDFSQSLVAFSRCMRGHGFATFPDPVISGSDARLPNLSGTGIDSTSPAFQAAQQACEALMPTPPPQARQPMNPADQAKWVQFAQCIRAHGVPDFPDPDFSNGGPKPLFGYDRTNETATVTAAMDACRPLLPVISSGSGGASRAPSASATPSGTGQS